MKIEDLKLFMKVVELGSFTAAANAQDLPRANVSRRISELENELGAQLFYRTTRSLSLTNNGEIYYQELQNAIELLDQANEQVSRHNGQIHGKIKLGVLAETYDLFQPVLFDFHDQYPHVELDIRNVTNGFNDMSLQGLDIAFHSGPLYDSNLIARKLLELDRCLIASPDYLKKHGYPQNIGALDKHLCIGFRRPNGEVDNQWHFSDQTIEMKPKLVSNSIGFIKNAALMNRGIAFLPKLLLIEELNSGQLTHILPQNSALKETGWLLYPQPKTLNQASRSLIKHLLVEIPKLAKNIQIPA